MLRTQLPPYSVSGVAFSFPALAALAGRLPIGSGRETAMAVLLAARLAGGAANGVLDGAHREARAAAARAWFRALCPDARIRAACSAVADATAMPRPGGAGEAAEALSATIERVAEVAARHLDGASRRELERLVKAARSHQG